MNANGDDNDNDDIDIDVDVDIFRKRMTFHVTIREKRTNGPNSTNKPTKLNEWTFILGL